MPNELIIKELQPNRSEVLRYLRLPKEALPTPEFSAALDAAERELLAAAEPRFVWRRFGIRQKPTGIKLSNSDVLLPGQDITELLTEADSCLLLAATLGITADNLIRRAEPADISHALLLDALASAAVENLCDQVQAWLEQKFAKENLFLTNRFSPGYGDLPLAMQRPLILLLDAGRQIGLTVSQSHLLLPRKSVTAIIGVCHSPQPRRTDKCAVCPARYTCPYRQSGRCNQ